MSPKRLLDLAIKPAVAELAAQGIPDSFEARRFLLAIALQESALLHRRQVTTDGAENGPAASFWQGEITGGMCLTLGHRLTETMMRKACADHNIEATPRGLWEAMRYHDIIAATAARLLVYTLPGKLPTTAVAGWAQYLDAWRPGKPHGSTWAKNWTLATITCTEVQYV